MSENPKILPPEPDGIAAIGTNPMSFGSAWQIASPLQKGMFLFLSAGTVASVSMFALGQFFQTRGVQSVLTSRVFLIIAWLFPTLATWQFALLLKARRWKWAAFILTLVLSAAAYLLDRAFPMPKIAVTENQQTHSPRAATAAEIAEEIAKKIPIAPEPHKTPTVPKAEAEPPIEIVTHPYDLSPDRRKKLLALLKPDEGNHDALRFGCMASSDSSCVAAGNFMVLFSEAGWSIDSDRVFRMEPTIPRDGVSLVTHLDTEPPKQPPHLGTWQVMSPSQTKIGKVLVEMGIPVNGSGQVSMPVGTLGVYFGPEPGPQTIELQLFLSNCEPTSESCDILASSADTHGSFLTNGNIHQLVHSKRPKKVLFQPDSSDKQFSVDESELPKKLTLGRCGGKVCRIIVRKFTKDGIILDSRQATITGDDGKMRSIMINWTVK